MRVFYTINAQTISASPGWNISIPASTITEAGNNYTTNATSAVNQTFVNFTIPGGYRTTYTVKIHKVDSDWHSNLSLWAQRTGSGTENYFILHGTIANGATFIQVTSSPQTFFMGTLVLFATRRTNIPIQYEIRGISVLLQVKTYSTTVVYTISN